MQQRKTQPKATEADDGESKWKWNRQGSLIYNESDDQASELIAGFDMDDTLIHVKSGAKFAKNASDWAFWNEKVPDELKLLAKQGYRIVIFTNQNGIAKGHQSEGGITKKIEQISASLGLSLTALIASDDDEYRKPNLGMWNYFINTLNGDKKVILEKSFYCGDAAGRKQGKVKDFSDSDLYNHIQPSNLFLSKFALNIGTTFKTPEQQFLKKDLNVDYSSNIGFNPKSIPKTGPLFKGEKEEANTQIKPEKQEMIIMIGSVGSGKSTFVANYLKDYVRINRDTLKTKEKCLAKAEEALAANQYVVIDNTNPKQDDRQAFIKLAKDHKVPVRAFYLEVTKDIAFHNDMQRDVNQHRKHFSKKVGSIPIHTFFKNVEKPTKAEGFDDVKVINFVAGPFENKSDEDTFYSFAKGK